MRSLLFVPGDSERKLAKARASEADALILDLEDAVTPGMRASARGRVCAFLANADRGHRQALWVRVNSVTSADALSDLAAVMPGRPDGIVLPKASPDAVRTLDNYLDAFEAALGIPAGSTRVLPIATETPPALFRMGDYAGCSARLAAITWGAEDLGAAVGAVSVRAADGRWSAVFELARSLCLLAASAACVPAVDTVYTDLRDAEGLAGSCRQARRDGFAGKLAIHPDQVVIVNSSFAPTVAEIEHARRVVQAFEDAGGAGVISLDGRMLDRPHLVQARKVLAMSGADQ
jgi:citrate lyase subunit beta/citryl-CoA lyase